MVEKHKIGVCPKCGSLDVVQKGEAYECRGCGKPFRNPGMLTFNTNKLYYIANEYIKHPMEEDELEGIDMTDIFWEEVEQMVANGEIVIININAKPRLGKSTAGMAIGIRIFELLQKYGFRKKTERFNLRNVARDDQEYSKIMRNPDTGFTVLVTDEENELEQGGENSSAEAALKKVFSDVQAGRYVHRVCCSPKSIVDPNADIILNVEARDKVSKMIHMKLYYRFNKGGQEIIQLLGFVNVPVGSLIENWEYKVKRVFFKPEKTKKDLSFIEDIARQDFFVEYMVKKYEKMDLITKEGIFRPRILDYAAVILEVVTHLSELARLSRVLNTNIVRNFVKMEMRRAKLPLSIVGEQLATQEAMGILDLYQAVFSLEAKSRSMGKKLLEGDLQKEAYELLKTQIRGTDAMVKELKLAIQAQLEELCHYKEVNLRYNSHLEEQNAVS